MYYFIINPDSSRGRGGRVWKILKQRLDKTKVEYQAFLTQKQGDARRFAGELTEERREPVTIVAVGGDGTVNEIVDGLWLQCPVTLGYIPAGSGNDLARSLRLPKNPYKGLKNILEENPSCRMVDYGVISYGEGQLCCRRFMVSAGIGMDGAVCHSILNSRKDGKKLFKGRAAYLQAGIKEMIAARPVKGYLLLDGVKKVEFNYLYFVSAHIHPFEGGGFLFAPDAVWDDGVLSLCVANHRKKASQSGGLLLYGKAVWKRKRGQILRLQRGNDSCGSSSGGSCRWRELFLSAGSTSSLYWQKSPNDCIEAMEE